MLVVATDGACRGNPGPGGWGWITPDGRSASGGDPATTNNRMELQAVLEALEALDGPLLIQTDSRYVMDIFTKWLTTWKAKDRLQKQKNVDLIEVIDRKLQGRGVRWEWVRGHDGHPLNEQADLLATSARDNFRSPRSQTAAPERPARPRRPPRSRAFAAKFAGLCADCATRFPEGAQIIRNSSGMYVHAGGCQGG
jgi:ribonuclease HI